MAYYGTVSTENPKINQPKFLLSIAAALGIVGIYLSTHAFSKGGDLPLSEESSKPLGPKVVIVRNVLVAADDIEQGEKLTPSLFTLEAKPTEGNPEIFISDLSSIERKYAQNKIQKGSILRSEEVGSSPISGGRLSEVIPEGYRAVTLQVDEAGGIEGWASPDVRVDVVWSSEFRGKPVVSTIVENARILSIDKSVAPQLGNSAPKYSVPRAVTLLVKKKDSQRIQLAKQSGSFSLSLRGESDKALAGSETTLVDKLLEPQRNAENRAIKGTVSVDGKQFNLIGMELVPANSKKNK